MAGLRQQLEDVDRDLSTARAAGQQACCDFAAKVREGHEVQCLQSAQECM
jgi:hypothetical protein